ncbi:hypothetical protein ACFE04_005064 [Oxalis oulophora]
MREDGYGNHGSQFKRPSSFTAAAAAAAGPSRQESSQSQLPSGGGGGANGGTGSAAVGGGVGGVAGAGASSQKLTTNDALSYLKEVKDMFQDQKNKYDMFLEVMKDFKASRTDTTGVIARVKELFKGHNHLIFGFNTFLPKGYEITLIEDDGPQKKAVEFEEAISFVNKIKKRFQNDDQVYKAFLDILNMYRKEHKDINEVYSEVAILFEDHSDLLDEFKRFLPDSSGPQVANNAPFGRNSNQRYTERSTGAPTLRQMPVDKPRRRDRIISSHCDSVDRPELDDDKMTMKMHKDQRKREKEHRDKRNRDQDDREPEHDNNRDLQRLSEKRKSSRKIEGLGANSNLSSFNDKETMMKMCNAEIIFFEKVKDRLCNPDDYQAFLKLLNIFNKGIIKRNDLQNLVTDLLGKYTDLMDEFNDFVERCENIDGFLAGVINTKSVCSDGQVSRPLKVEDKDMKEHKRDLEAAREKERCKEKYMGKSIQELDLSNCERCTPSYRLLPDDYPIPLASQRSELGAQLLNDNWVSVTSGSEDYSFKHMRRNQYEESLFRCEDDRYELDMLLESVSSTAKRTNELLNLVNENKINLESPFCIEDNFTALNLRCIERLYGDHGLDVLDTLRKNPTHAISILSTRLKQKQDEWTKCRLDFNKVWADIYAKNHYKSLDHRSFYFKQQDSKNLSPKGEPIFQRLKYFSVIEFASAVIAEIKELKEKHQADDILSTISAGNLQPEVAHVEYEYSDINIHEDLYKLIHFSCEEICSKDQLTKVMSFWTTFFEPMLGVPSRSKDANGPEDVGKPTLSAKAISRVTKGHGSPETNSKRPKSSENGDENNLTLPKVTSSGNIIAKGESSHDLEQKIEVSDKISGLSTQVVIGGVNTHGRSNNESVPELCRANGTASEEYVPKANVGTISPSKQAFQAVDTTTPVSMPNGTCTDGDKNSEEISLMSKIEKEEGELSPTRDFDEDDFAVAAKRKPDGGSRQFQPENGEASNSQDVVLENDAEADDEDSENASEASGSESAGDECSQEEHEEDDKAESEGEADADGHIGGDATSAPMSERFLLSVKPLAKHVKEAAHNVQWKDSRIFYGNDDFYVLFKLHQILYDRIFSAKTNTAGSEMKWKTPKDAISSDPYGSFMTALYNLLDGSADNSMFEDECRDILGNQSYVLFTLDKLIYKLVKQLITVATDEMDIKLLNLHEYENSRGPGKFSDSVYHENARVLLHEENLYRLKFSTASSLVSIQLMDNLIEKPELFGVAMDPTFAAYLYSDFLPVFASKKEPQGIALERNKRKYSSLDENSAMLTAMEGVQLINGLECKIACNTYKVKLALQMSMSTVQPTSVRLSSTPKYPHPSLSRSKIGGVCDYDDSVILSVLRMNYFLTDDCLNGMTDFLCAGY